MIHNYAEASERLFDALSRRENDEIRGLFLAAMRECALMCALDSAANPTVGVGQWSGGRISICQEWTKGVEDALARAKGKASPDVGPGLALPPD